MIITKERQRRVIMVLSFVLALSLICGSVYLHVRQKHHFGRMRHEQRFVYTTNDVEEIVLLTTPPTVSGESSDELLYTARNDYEEENVYSISESSSESLSEVDLISAELSDHQQSHIAYDCLQCLCQTVNRCRPATCGTGVACGLYRISQPYWEDAEKPTVDAYDYDANTGDEGYAACVNDTSCSERAVNAYIRKYSRDCNRDGKIDCQDYIALHILGPSGCLQRELLPLFYTRMEACLTTMILK